MDNSTNYDLNLILKLMNKNLINNMDNHSKALKWARSNDKFSKVSQCYLFSNENLRAYYPKFDINNKNVLTVVGSGDQVLSAILYGAKEVDSFDSNKFAYYTFMLKRYAIMNLSYSEFKRFYFLNDNYNRLEDYKKISKNMHEENVKYIWDNIFYTYPKNFCDCFFEASVLYHLVVERIPYMDYDSFYKLKNQLHDVNINFMNTDILKIDKFDNQYSFINLSNILNYCNNKEKFLKLINNLKSNNLDDNGSILLNYYWTCYHLFQNDKINGEIYKKLGVTNMKIDNLAINDSIQKGSAIIYTKKSK